VKIKLVGDTRNRNQTKSFLNMMMMMMMMKLGPPIATGISPVHWFY